MFPIRHRSIFRSRYMALLWAAGIIWLAYDVAAGSEPESGSNNQAAATDVTGAPVTQQDIDTLKSVMNTM